MRRSLTVLLSVIFITAGFRGARAQAVARLDLYDLQTGGFPSITLGLDPYDSSGNYLVGLTREAVTILEDNQPITPDTLEDFQPGVHFALALDPGPAFAFRDITAVSRYDKVYNILQEWAATHSDTLGDDLSFVPTAGDLSAHLPTTTAFSQALEAYSPVLALVKPSLDTLANALDAVSEQNSPAGMKRSVLFVSSPQTSDTIPILQNLTQRAVSEHIQVNVWIVCSSDFFNTSGATALKDLSIQTGGQYVLFSYEEPLPGLETYLAPMRHAYQASYTSHLLAGGSHTLAALVNANGETLTSLPLPFELDIQPPNPILVSPPNQIVRQAVDEKNIDTAHFEPLSQPIEALVEFPDGRERALSSTSLYVDSQKVAENTSAPFDRFTWDVSGYAESGQHYLSVEAVDVYGLRRTSLPVPVTVTVILPQRGLLPFLSRNKTWVSVGAIGVAGLALGVILVSGVSRRRSRKRKQARQDPLTQPVVRQRKDQRKLKAFSKGQKESEAYLIRLRDDGHSLTAPPISVIIPEMTFGSDPLRVTRILDDPSVSPLHARLKAEKGLYVLYDEGSAAGTWVNYEMLKEPCRLQHGDLLQIGKISYRFMLRKPPDKPAPKVTPTRP